LVAVIVGSLWLFRTSSSKSQSFTPITLTPVNITRGDPAQGSEIILPLDHPILKISLKLPEPANSGTRYRVELRNGRGEKKVLEPSEQNSESVSVKVPAAELVRGLYYLKLLSTSADGTEPQVSGTYLLNVK
jgi:hypothetical protein